MTDLRLTPEEASELLLALEAQLHGMRVELASAEVREFKHELRTRLDRLEGIARHLRAELPAGATSHP